MPSAISKSNSKLIAGLKNKKNRNKHNLFVVEGHKTVFELLQSPLTVRMLVAKPQFFTQNNNIPAYVQLFTATEREFAQISSLKTPPGILAVAEKPKHKLNIADLKGRLSFFLDDINDPGNMGTLIRLANWFGVEQIVCSAGTVEAYNPKVVQAAMGALFRVSVHYTQTKSGFLQAVKQELNLPVLGTFLAGKNIYKHKLPSNSLLILGSESHGISPEVEPFCNQKIYIPAFSPPGQQPESLNVAVAAALACAEIRRQNSS